MADMTVTQARVATQTLSRERTPITFTRVLFYILVVVLFVFCLFPFYWALVSSVKADNELFQMPPTYFPVSPTLSNYYDVLVTRNFPHNMLNSAIVSVSTVALSLVVGSLCAYALARLHFPGQRFLLGFVLAVSTFPGIAIISPLYVEIRNLGWVNTYQGLIGPYLVFSLPFAIWLMTAFFRQLPRELEEAAKVDGCNPIQAMVLVMMPLATPAFVTIGLLGFIAAWNEFLFALLFTVTDATRTVPVAIVFFSGYHSVPWGSIMAASVLVTIPLIILVLIFQGRIVAGLTAGAIKG